MIQYNNYGKTYFTTAFAQRSIQSTRNYNLFLDC